MDLTKDEALLITSRANIYHFSKIDAEAGVFLLLAKRQNFVFSDALSIKTASKIARAFIPVAIDKNNIDWWRNLLTKLKIKIIYFEPYSLSYSKLTKFRKMSQAIAQLKPSKIDLQAIRSKKSKHEINKIKKSAQITEKILQEIIKICQSKSQNYKISEFDIVLEIYKQAINYGCHELSFPPIAAFGKNTGIPHHQPSRFRYLKRGDIVLADLGVRYKNYCSDITRTFFTAPPTAHQMEIYNKVLAVQSKTIKKIKDGVSASKLYNDACADFGRLSPHFTHDLGHGVGLEIHEHPNLKQKSPDVLRSGQVLTVEPGLYFSWGGVRLEDMAVVEDNGCRVLTNALPLLHFPA